MDRARGIIVDSSILSLLVVGGVSRDLIGTYKRTRQYESIDYQKVESYIAQFPSVFTTPHIATETANLIGALKGKHLLAARAVLARAMNTWIEIYEPTKVIAASPFYPYLGLADAAIARCAQENDHEVLTDDLDLHNALKKLGIPSVKYSHWRTARWFLD